MSFINQNNIFNKSSSTTCILQGVRKGTDDTKCSMTFVACSVLGVRCLDWELVLHMQA